MHYLPEVIEDEWSKRFFESDEDFFYHPLSVNPLCCKFDKYTQPRNFMALAYKNIPEDNKELSDISQDYWGVPVIEKEYEWFNTMVNTFTRGILGAACIYSKMHVARLRYLSNSIKNAPDTNLCSVLKQIYGVASPCAIREYRVAKFFTNTEFSTQSRQHLQAFQAYKDAARYNTSEEEVPILAMICLKVSMVFMRTTCEDPEATEDAKIEANKDTKTIMEVVFGIPYFGPSAKTAKHYPYVFAGEPAIVSGAFRLKKRIIKDLEKKFNDYKKKEVSISKAEKKAERYESLIDKASQLNLNISSFDRIDDPEPEEDKDMRDN